jgi:micrococcal nuclease
MGFLSQLGLFADTTSMITLFFSFTFLLEPSFGRPAKSVFPCEHDANNFRCVKYVKNYDADTITVEIPGIHPLLGNKINVRVSGVDTPELRTKNQCEKAAGYKAKLAVEKILKKAERIDLVGVRRGKYFRIVADVIVDGASIGEYLLKAKMAYKYNGATKDLINWCLPNNQPRAPAKQH